MAIIMMKTNLNLKKLFKFFLFFGCLLLIFYFSSQTSENSLELSSKFSDFLEDVIANYFFLYGFDCSFFVRKLAHFSLYFFLGIITFYLLNEYFSSLIKCFLFTFFICFFCACSDEFHQLFVFGRDGKFLDILIDCSGVLFSFLVLWIIRKRKLP